MLLVRWRLPAFPFHVWFLKTLFPDFLAHDCIGLSEQTDAQRTLRVSDESKRCAPAFLSVLECVRFGGERILLRSVSQNLRRTCFKLCRSCLSTPTLAL